MESEHDRVAQDIKQYRQTVRARMPVKYHKILNTPAEQELMHDWFVKRGLKVVKSNYTYYDDKTHTLYHHAPDDKAAVARDYIRFARRPVKLARANELNTNTHQTRLAIARHVLQEAGITPAQVQAVLTHDGRPGVAALVGAPVSPSLARYAAAWMGMLTGQKAMTVFHPGAGEDTLHIIDSPHGQEHVGEYLRRAGVQQFSLQSRGQGTRAFVVAPMDLGDVQNAARGLQGTSQAVQGTAVRLGGDRAAYRQVIDDAEKEAGGE